MRKPELTIADPNPSRPPLVIDLERELLRTDLALESLFALLKEQPLTAARLSICMLARRKQAVVLIEHCRGVDPEVLPYDAAIIDKIKTERVLGNQVWLSSNEYRIYAQSIASHLQLFDRIIPPEDASAANGPRNASRRKPQNSIAAWINSIRLHQWLKNLLVFVPLFASHWVGERRPMLQAALAFLLFGLCASSVYLLNDLLDLTDDRHHSSKRFRPLAAGRLTVRAALVAIPLLLVVAIGTAYWLLPLTFCAALLSYYAITLSYSLLLKRVMMLDVVVLALLYTLRVVAGTLAIDGNLTFWMLAFSLFIFMSLAMAKRYAELIAARSFGASGKVRGRGYTRSDLEMISSLGGSSGYIAVLVLALYIQDRSTIALYSHPRILWLSCPLLLFWIGRTWMLTHRGQMHDDPLVFAIRDRVSLVIAACFGLVFMLAA